MKKLAKVNREYVVLTLDYTGNVVDSCPDVEVCQREGEHLLVMDTREDGFHFVYSDRLEVGYWVHPTLITITHEVE